MWPAHSQSVPHILLCFKMKVQFLVFWMCTALMTYVSEKPLYVTCGGIAVVRHHLLPPPSFLHFQTTALMMCMVGRWKKKWLSLQVQQVHMFTVTADHENHNEKLKAHADDISLMYWL